MAQDRERIEQAQAEENRIRDECTTPQHRVVEGIETSLTKRLQQVDDLLESLQEEEWADEEEEGVQNEASQRRYDTDDAHDNENSASLLDQVLAMVLGTLPKRKGDTPEQHYAYIRGEHQEIVQQWRQEFGRLPKSFAMKSNERNDGGAPETTTGSSNHNNDDDRSRIKSTLSSAGLTMDDILASLEEPMDDNDWDDWDDTDDWETQFDATEAALENATQPEPKPKENSPAKTYVPTTTKGPAAIKEDSVPTQPKKRATTGLRPGGRLQMT